MRSRNGYGDIDALEVPALRGDFIEQAARLGQCRRYSDADVARACRLGARAVA